VEYTRTGESRSISFSFCVATLTQELLLGYCGLMLPQASEWPKKLAQDALGHPPNDRSLCASHTWNLRFFRALSLGGRPWVSELSVLTFKKKSIGDAGMGHAEGSTPSPRPDNCLWREVLMYMHREDGVVAMAVR